MHHKSILVTRLSLGGAVAHTALVFVLCNLVEPRWLFEAGHKLGASLLPNLEYEDRVCNGILLKLESKMHNADFKCKCIYEKKMSKMLSKL